MLAKPRTNWLGFLGRPLLVLAAAACFLAVFALLRELGYALTAHFSGGSLLDFPVNLFNLGQRATVTGEFTAAQRSLQAAVRLVIPLAAWAVFIGLAPRRAGLAVELAKLVSTALVALIVLAWAVTPLLALIGRAPAGADPVRFLANTNAQPLWISAGAFVVLLGVISLAEARLADPRRTLAALSSAAPANSAANRPIVVFVALALVAVVLAFSIDAFARARSGILPEGYREAAGVDLKWLPAFEQTLYKFHVDRPQEVSLILVLRDVQFDHMNVKVVGPDGATWGVLHTDEFAAPYDHVAWRDVLAPGDYRVAVDTEPSTGTLTLYTKGLAE